MKTLSEADIIAKIKQRTCFSATITGGAFTLKIESYEPALSVAIHNGGNLRLELAENCLLTKDERYYEEDPFTGSFIAQQPITITCHDSRYEYDLNRTPDDCVYKTAWGREVWKTALSAESVSVSLEKHAQFYRVMDSLLEALSADFGKCIVYDIHSYNYQRYERTDLPVFNLGTSTVTTENWRPLIDTWMEILHNMKVDGVEITSAENDIFSGKGFLAVHCHKQHPDVLVLATEVKKVFMNEIEGTEKSPILLSMQHVFNTSIQNNTASCF